VDDERSPEAIDVLTFIVRMVPVGAVLFVDGVVYEVGEGLIWRDSALCDANSSVIPACRVEEHAMMMNSGIIVSKRICLCQSQKRVAKLRMEYLLHVQQAHRLR